MSFNLEKDLKYAETDAPTFIDLIKSDKKYKDQNEDDLEESIYKILTDELDADDRWTYYCNIKVTDFLPDAKLLMEYDNFSGKPYEVADSVCRGLSIYQYNKYYVTYSYHGLNDYGSFCIPCYNSGTTYDFVSGSNFQVYEKICVKELVKYHNITDIDAIAKIFSVVYEDNGRQKFIKYCKNRFDCLSDPKKNLHTFTK